MTNHTELARVEDEAATWAVLLADDPDNNEQLRQFRAWLNACALHAEEWTRTRRVYEGLGELPAATQEQWPNEVSEECRQRRVGMKAAKCGTLHSGLKKERSLSNKEVAEDNRFRCLPARSVSWKNSLVSLTIAACLVLVFLPYLTLQLSADYVSGTGEQQTHVLQDGSTLTLAPESAVDVRYTEGVRHVRLLKGGRVL